MNIWEGCEDCKQGIKIASGKKQRRFCNCVKEKALIELMTKAGCEEIEITFDHKLLSKELLYKAKDIAEMKHKGVYLSGMVGGGKTIFAATIIRAYYSGRIKEYLNDAISLCHCKGKGCEDCGHTGINYRGQIGATKGTPARYIVGYELRKHMQNSALSDSRATAKMKEFIEADILIIDEWQQLLEKEFSRDEIFELVDRRYRKQKTTCLISNLPRDDRHILERGTRIVSRLWDYERTFNEKDWRLVK